MAQIGKYELIELLGGGMSHVYRARDTVLGRTVAVKILTEQGCADPEAKSRFLAEARMASNIHHDNIIAIHDYGEEGGRPFMVMEFLVGEDLRHAIKNGHTGDLNQRLGIALQLARALEFVHAHHIVHRDIKPENIHIDGSGKVKLMDFGIAKVEGLSLTQAGTTVGTPYYMAPEQVLGEPTTEQVDVYAFGALLFELLCGKRAVDAESVERLFYIILNVPLDLQPLASAGVPPEVIGLVGRCTAKKREERVRTLAEVRRELERLTAGETPAPHPEAAKPRAAKPPAAEPRPAKSKRAILAAAALVLAAGLAAGGWFAFLRPHPQPEPSKVPAGMVLVPGGTFLAGADRHTATLPDFYIDKTEVPNVEYLKFCQATSRPIPAGTTAERAEYPVVNVNYFDAQSFATWSGKRLPTALEWEKAARGTDGRKYPWGDDARTDLAVVDAPNTVPEPMFANGASPYGAVHMAGNVWEWVDDRQTPSIDAIKIFSGIMTPPPLPTDPWYAIKGGSFRRPIDQAVTDDSASTPARYAGDDLGFRCVKDPAR